MKRFVALIMVLAMSLGLIGCVPAQKQLGDGNDVILNINMTGAGYGTQWLKEAKGRFETEFANKKYGDNGQYEGVYININNDSGVTPDKFGDSPNHIMFGGASAQTLAAYGTALNLSADGKDGLTGEDKEEWGFNAYEEIYTNTGDNAGIKSIADLMLEQDIYNYKAMDDGELYGLPSFEVFAGATYDKDLFDAKGYYFVDTSKTNRKIEISEKKYPILANTLDGKADPYYDEMVFYLVDKKNDAEWEQHKTVGPDGLPNTQDDGLPSSLLELIALCAYMKKEGVYPLQFTGKYAADYSDTFIYGLVFSLMGKERAQVTRDFKGEVEVVVSLTGENGTSDKSDPVRYLLPAIKAIRIPKTETITVTEETAFYTQMSVERYYAMALMEVFKSQDWFAPGSDPSKGNMVDHIGAEENFVYSNYRKPNGTTGAKIAFLSESSYWYNESKTAIANFKTANKKADRGVRWYSYPVNIANTVTGVEGATDTTHNITESVEGKENVVAVSKQTQIIVNKLAIEKSNQGKEVLLEVVKDFLQFWYREDELVKTTISQGMGRNMNFKMPEEKTGDWAGFYKELNDLKEESYVLPMSAANRTFYNLTDRFKLGEGGRYFNCCKQFTNDLLNGEHGVREGFERQIWGPADWKGYYQGQYFDADKTDKSYLDAYIKYIKDNGADVVYRQPFDAWV